MAPVMADYMLVFRKHGQNPEPIHAGKSEKYSNDKGWITGDEWIEWARAVWYGARKGLPGGIRETDVLNVAIARSTSPSGKASRAMPRMPLRGLLKAAAT